MSFVIFVVQIVPDSKAIQPNSETGCLRCGTCCRKGGPTLHREDRDLVESGVLPVNLLYTIRTGEIVRDPVRETTLYADSDIIKLRGSGRDWRCVLFDEDNSQCRKYDNRPAECRAMECWDTREIEAMYAHDRLTRQDLLGGIEGLWEFIIEHEDKCDYRKLRYLKSEMEDGDNGDAADQILEMIRYDAAARELSVEKAGTDPEHLEFLFGRPMSVTINGLGLRLKKEGETTTVDLNANQGQIKK